MVLFLVAIGLGFLATGGILILVRQVGILDMPNERSAHTSPMPTLGGVGIILGVWGALAVGGLMGTQAPVVWQGLLIGSGILMVLVYDEIRPLGRLTKLILQVGTAGVMVGADVVLSRIYIPGWMDIGLHFWAIPVTFLWFLGIQNFYNFMDGIDALAGLEGVLVAGLWAMIASGLMSSETTLPIVIAGASLGFLFLNFPPGKIFMGDAGSNFLGLTLGVMAVLGDGMGLPFGVSLLLLGAFLFDTIYTLLRRLFRRENITLAHRFHLYQRLDRMGWSHLRINVVYGLCTLLLGGVGYLWVYGHAQVAFRATVGMLVLMGMAAGWVEWRWKAWSMLGKCHGV